MRSVVEVAHLDAVVVDSSWAVDGSDRGADDGSVITNDSSWGNDVNSVDWTLVNKWSLVNNWSSEWASNDSSNWGWSSVSN